MTEKLDFPFFWTLNIKLNTFNWKIVTCKQWLRQVMNICTSPYLTENAIVLVFQRGHAQSLRQSQSYSSQCSKPRHGRILGGPRRPQERQRCNLWVRNPLRILEQWKLMAKLGDWWGSACPTRALVYTIFSESRPRAAQVSGILCSDFSSDKTLVNRTTWNGS